MERNAKKIMASNKNKMALDVVYVFIMLLTAQEYMLSTENMPELWEIKLKIELND